MMVLKPKPPVTEEKKVCRGGMRGGVDAASGWPGSALPPPHGQDSITSF